MPLDPQALEQQLARLDLIHDLDQGHWGEEGESVWQACRQELLTTASERLVDVPLTRAEEEALIMADCVLDPYDGRPTWDVEGVRHPGFTLHLAPGHWQEAASDEEYASLNVRPTSGERYDSRQYWRREHWPTSEARVEALTEGLERMRASAHWDKTSELLIGLPLDALLARARALLALKRSAMAAAPARSAARERPPAELVSPAAPADARTSA